MYKQLGYATAAATLVIAASSAGNALAQAPSYDWEVHAAVTGVDTAKSPSSLAFQLDSDAGGCAVGQWLTFPIGGADARAISDQASRVTQLLRTAQSTKAPLHVHGNNAGCSVSWISVEN